MDRRFATLGLPLDLDTTVDPMLVKKASLDLALTSSRECEGRKRASISASHAGTTFERWAERPRVGPSRAY